MRETDINEAASLLDSVKQTQERTRTRLRPGMHEISGVMAAEWAGIIVAAPWSHSPRRDVALGIFVLAVTIPGVVVGIRSRKNLGTRNSVATWTITGATFVSGALVNALLDGDVQKTALGLTLSIAVLTIGGLCRSALITGMGGAFAVIALARLLDASKPIMIAALVVYGAAAMYLGRSQFFTKDEVTA